MCPRANVGSAFTQVRMISDAFFSRVMIDIIPSSNCGNAAPGSQLYPFPVTSRATKRFVFMLQCLSVCNLDLVKARTVFLIRRI